MSSHHPAAPFPSPKTAAEIRSMGEDRPPLEPPARTSRPGEGGVTIQKVEIVVTGGSDPERVARAMQAEMARLGENRRTRRFSRNYTAIDNPQAQEREATLLRAELATFKRFALRGWLSMLFAQLQGAP